jgi:hypothetical protein
MALTDEQTQQIREEEIERIRIRNKLRGAWSPRRVLVFWAVVMAGAVILWSVLRNH